MMTATCNMNNCRRRCPDDEPFCSEHREDRNWQAEAKYWQRKAETAESALAASKAEREALVEGLGPFAEIANRTTNLYLSPNDRIVLGARALISKTGEGR